VFKVSTATASCQTSGYTPGQGAMMTFGMSFVGLAAIDTLYVAEHVVQDARLASIDTTTTKMTVIGKITPDIGDCELTGTGDGRLYAFCPNERVAILAELDRHVSTNGRLDGRRRRASAVGSAVAGTRAACRAVALLGGLDARVAADPDRTARRRRPAARRARPRRRPAIPQAGARGPPGRLPARIVLPLRGSAGGERVLLLRTERGGARLRLYATRVAHAGPGGRHRLGDVRGESTDEKRQHEDRRSSHRAPCY